MDEKDYAPDSDTDTDSSVELLPAVEFTIEPENVILNNYIQHSISDALYKYFLKVSKDNAYADIENLHKLILSMLPYESDKISNLSIRFYDRNGQLHRDNDLPAVIKANGSMEWYQHGRLDRGGDQPAVIDTVNSRFLWFKHGQLHREGDQPAYIDKKEQMWYHEGELHRDNDLPAIIHSNGWAEWYQHGELIEIVEFETEEVE